MPVHDRLQMPEERGRVLDLVHDDRGRMSVQERGRFFFSLLGFGRQVERHERVLRKEPEQRRGFAGLPGAGEHDHGAGPGRLPEARLHVARDPHA